MMGMRLRNLTLPLLLSLALVAPRATRALLHFSLTNVCARFKTKAQSAKKILEAWMDEKVPAQLVVQACNKTANKRNLQALDEIINARELGYARQLQSRTRRVGKGPIAQAAVTQEMQVRIKR
jgi:hypothetical protein